MTLKSKFTNQLLQVLQQLSIHDFVQHHFVMLEAVDQTTEGLANALDALLVLIGQTAGKKRKAVRDEVEVVGMQILTAIRGDRQRCTLSGDVKEVDKLQTS